MREPALPWRCPWCGAVAALATRHVVICHSRTCACGAVALAAPARDTDEIIDDAIAIFGVAPAALTPVDADRLAALRLAGVDVRDAGTTDAGPASPQPIRLLWFKR